jgi:hypothetical protein
LVLDQAAGHAVGIHTIVGVGQIAGKRRGVHIVTVLIGDARDHIVDRGHWLLQRDEGRKTKDESKIFLHSAN